MRLLFIILLALYPAQSLFAQQSTRGELEKRRNSLLNEIAETQQQLENTKKDKKATLSQLKALNAKLQARQKLIDNINTELDKIDGDIHMSAAEIEKLNKNLDILRARYAQSMRYAYKHRTNQNMMAFLFSANDFNDALRRMSYLKKYRDYRKNQAEDIRKTQSKLSSKIGELNVQKTKKGNLLKAEESQKNVIQEEKKQTDLVANELKGREKELMAQIQQNQRTAKKLEASIKAQIAKEIELARKKAEEEARKRAAAEALARKKEAEEEARRKAAQMASANKPATNNNAGGNAYSAGNQTVTLNTGRPPANAPATDAGSTPKTGTPATGTDKTTTTTRTLAANTTPPPSRPAAERTSYKLSLTPDVQALSNNFAANRGRLPWPVEKGFISGQYGRHPHPLFPKVMIDNNGIDIATSEGASVRAVFEGVVQTVTNIDGVMVMINHGEYFTIYTNLAGASVKAGDKVTAKQVIGRAGKNDDGDNMMNFQVWKISGNSNYATVNPSDWIAR
jgi:septal ring factor EnvC (AmiA/AmiB activator)